MSAYSKDTIHMLWIGGSLSTMERLAMASFLAQGHQVVLHSYGPIEAVPKGVELADGTAILAQEHIFQNQAQGIGQGGFASFADWFRYELLQQHPGWWVDTDVVCLAPFDFDTYNVIATSREGEWGSPALNCVMRLDQNDPLLDYCVTYCRANDVEQLARESFIALGPSLVQRGIRELGLQTYEAAPDIFCPISWRHSRFFTQGPLARQIYNLKRRLKGGERVERVKPQTKAVHLWQSTWKLGQIDIDGTHHPQSLYERWKAQYLPASP